MLSVETVAKLIEAAEIAAYDRGYRHGWDDCERMRLAYALQDWDQP